MEPLYDPVAVQEENYFEVVLRTRGEASPACERLNTTLRELDLRDAVTVSPEATIRDCIRAMRRHRIGSILVAAEDEVVGIFTERDVLNRVALEDFDMSRTPVSEVMTPQPETLGVYDSISFAINLMSDSGYRHIPVTDHGGRPLHIVSVRDLAAFLADCYPEAVKNLPPNPGSYASARNGG